MSWFQAQWKKQFPHGFFVSTESELAIHQEQQELAVPNVVIEAVVENPSRPREQLTGGLLIGAIYSACNQVEVFNRGVGAVFCCTHDTSQFPSYASSSRKLKSNLGITWARLIWRDADDQVFERGDIEAVVRDMHKFRKAGKTVLVHCVMGMSRSAVLVLAYLLAVDHSKTVDDALADLMKVRAVKPREAFLKQLREMHKDGFFNTIDLEPLKTSL